MKVLTDEINNLIGLEGGSGKLFWKVLSLRKGIGTSYPSIKNGRLLHYSEPDYWKYKVRVDYNCVYLTIVGNPVACENYLKQHNYAAIAISPVCVCIRLQEYVNGIIYN